MEEGGKKACVCQLSPLHPTLQGEMEEHFYMVQLKDLASYRDKISAIFVFVSPQVDEALLSSLPGLRVVGNCAVGYNHIDLQACKRRGIRVGYTPDILNDATADTGWTLLLAAARRVPEGDAICRHPNTKTFDTTWFGAQVSKTTLGIIGMGRIGLEVAHRARGFKMEVLYHNRRRCSPEVEESVGATYVESLEELLSKSDHVMLVAPASPTTYHMMSSKEFAAMKKTATFINISRGSLVDQEALVHALKTGSIAAAGLDVTDPEPLPRDHTLLQLPNTVLTPHIGSATLQTRHEMLQLTIRNIKAALEGGEMPCEVNLSDT